MFPVLSSDSQCFTTAMRKLRRIYTLDQKKIISSHPSPFFGSSNLTMLLRRVLFAYLISKKMLPYIKDWLYLGYSVILAKCGLVFVSLDNLDVILSNFHSFPWIFFAMETVSYLKTNSL